jgi:hypothetical protein
MTDRIHSVTLILSSDRRIDDAQALIDACKMFRGVQEVVPNVRDLSEAMVAESRIKDELRRKLLEVLK